VGHLVGEHGGELVLVLHPRQKAGVDEHRAVRVGEGVEGGVLDHVHPVGDLGIGGHPRRLQPADQPLEVVHQQRVVVQRHLGEQLVLLGARLVPQHPLVAQRLEGRAGGRDRR
jgi:hypothetical protein